MFMEHLKELMFHGANFRKCYIREGQRGYRSVDEHLLNF